MRNTSTNLDV
jgi:hypothetical protein